MKAPTPNKEALSSLDFQGLDKALKKLKWVGGCSLSVRLDSPRHDAKFVSRIYRLKNYYHGI